MFSVLPPPPRYSGGGPYHPTGITGVVPLIETNNTLTFPAGEEWQFLVGEGTYVLKEDLHLATPPPHPSESAIPNTNPLSTAPQPATAGTKISLVSLSDTPPPNLYKDPASPVLPTDGTSASFQEASPIPRPSNDGGLTSGDSRATSNSDAPTSSTQTRSTPAFGEGNAMLAPAPSKDANRRRRPKNNVTKSNSSFISRVILHDNLSRKLADRPANGMFAFCNINRAFEWLDLSSQTKQDYLTKFLFTKAHCLCHDVNKVTKSASNFDVISGFSTGEIIWWEPFSQRYTRMNKNGTVNSTPVAEIRWIPGSENLFLAGHMDGTLIVYDKEREDAPFLPEGEATSANSSDAGDTPDRTYAGARIQISKSVHSRNQKTNPVAVWKLSNHRINAFAFSPDHRHLAAVSEDGTLRIMDYLREELLDIFYAYYGGLTCVCWTPDGKYILTGGQDDLISIWSLADSALVARCEGHQSWVSALAFDPWRCDERNYRFGSVGEDGRLCLWDFGVGMLYRPKNSTRQRGSISTSYGNAPRDDSMSPQGRRKRSESGMDGEDGATGIFHPVEPRARVPMLPPVLSTSIHNSPACWLEFTEDAIMTSDKSGHIRTWSRPGNEKGL